DWPQWTASQNAPGDRPPHGAASARQTRMLPYWLAPPEPIPLHARLGIAGGQRRFLLPAMDTVAPRTGLLCGHPFAGRVRDAVRGRSSRCRRSVVLGL